MKILQLQHAPKKTKDETVENIRKILDCRKDDDTDFITLPEMFACPYQIEKFPEYAEEECGTLWSACSKMAKECNSYLSAGTIPELAEDGKIYNTAYVFDRNGRQIAKHRKVHLFDIAIKNGQFFRESDVLSAGERTTIFDTEWGTMGIAICYDIRFPEMFREMALAGAKVVFVPASFNMTTGPVHWELMFRSQAVFSQVFMVGTAAPLDSEVPYRSYGHTIITDPWGTVMNQMDQEAGEMVTDIDLSRVEKIRNQLPLLKSVGR